MAFYSREPLRALRQVLGDLFLVAWVIVWVQVAQVVYAAILRMQTPLTALQDGAQTVSRNLSDAGREATRVPLVGRELARPLERAARAMGDLAGAGADQAAAVQQAAWWVAVAVVAVPVVCLLLVWLPARWRFVARSLSAHRLSGSAAGRDLLALRALASGTPGRVLRVDPDPVAAWRAGDPGVVGALAEVELRRAGVRGVLPR